MRLVLAILALLALLALAWARPERFGSRAAEGDETIFVSVASYRDAQCGATIRSLFDQADKPGRVFVGVCEQNSGDAKEACVPAALPKNVRRVSLPHTEAKGPTYARYLCSTLYAGEDWFMQIDSHTKLVKGWDTLVIANARKCPSKKAVLTHYPRVVEEYGKDQKGVPVLCKSKWGEGGVPTFEAVIMDPPKDGVPRRVPFTSGGFLFMPGQAVRDVPYDPDLPHLFQGEEILYSARLWTSGYDFYTPLDNIVFHHYERKDAPKFWNDLPSYRAAQAETMRKVRRLLGIEQPPLPGYRYGMGAARPLEEYLKFAGLDVVKKTADSDKKFCV